MARLEGPSIALAFQRQTLGSDTATRTVSHPSPGTHPSHPGQLFTVQYTLLPRARTGSSLGKESKERGRERKETAFDSEARLYEKRLAASGHTWYPPPHTAKQAATLLRHYYGRVRSGLL